MQVSKYNNTINITVATNLNVEKAEAKKSERAHTHTLATK